MPKPVTTIDPKITPDPKLEKRTRRILQSSTSYQFYSKLMHVNMVSWAEKVCARSCLKENP